MLQGIYGTALAMESSSREHEAIAQNLAHVRMPGYRRLQTVQGTFDNQVHESNKRLTEASSTGLRGGHFTHDFTPGAMVQTDRPFDLAIDGPGFFELETENGSVFTRNGSFTLTNEGKLVNSEGFGVVGLAGPIQISPELLSETVHISTDGTVAVGETRIGQLRLVEFADPSQLESVGTTTFRAPDGVSPDQVDTKLAVGFLEESNVHPVLELVAMIDSQRRHEAATRSLKTLMKSLEQHINISQ